MFHFPGFPPPALYIQAGVTPHHGCRVPPFGHPRINARLTAPRGLSRPPTSFIGSWYQGIHHAPLTTYTKPATRRAHHTQRSEHTKKPNTLQTTTTPHPPRERGGTRADGCDARIHYPVHKHPPTTHHTRPDTTTPPPPRHPHRIHDTNRPRRRGERLLRGLWQARTPETTHPAPGHDTNPPRQWRGRAEPGRACSLRTQQCADTHHPRTRPADTAAEARGSGRAGRLRCSTNERTPRRAFGGYAKGC
jgi:hypothetical protein